MLPKGLSAAEDSAISEDLHDVLVREVEENLELGFGRAGEPSIDKEGGVGIELRRGAVRGEAEAPSSASEDVAAVKRCFVDGG